MIPDTEGMSWQAICHAMQKHRDQSIAQVQPAVPELPSELPRNVTSLPGQLLSAEVVSLTEALPEDLVSQLRARQITSKTLTTAFLQRAGLACKLTNCITELLPSRALQRAEYLDSYIAEHGKPIGPLHGLPISVKEMVGMQGLDLNSAFVSWAGREPPKADALLLQLLWNAGAVFYCRTTQPQSLMQLETTSNLYGTTVNPHNTLLTAGGSSGGEGALLGVRGSCLGVGTDIGGSIRVPAANNGIFGFKPTSLRLPLVGCQATMAGQELVVPAIGPLSTSLEGMKMFMRAVIGQKPWLVDPNLVSMPWKEESQLRSGQDGRRKLRVGIMEDDGIVRPHPPILRGLRSMVERLCRDPDIECVDFPAYKHDEAWKLTSTLYFADGGAEEMEAIDASREPWLPLSEWVVKENANVRELHVRDSWKLVVQKKQYKVAYQQHWNSIGTSILGPAEGTIDAARVTSSDRPIVDVLLCPVGPGCAPPHGNSKYWSYSSQWNLLEYPAIAFPTGLFCGPGDQANDAYVPRNDIDKWHHELYQQDVYAGAPISLQLVARRFEDEKVIEALEMMLETFNSGL
ncbi:Putative amidase [Septoria linicola]|uniref:amidase n=1 Tax=Septoria linicola TaxID=215465 RepID=A0A9Q9EKP6_9PEZI|nr:Putative amidase [Septoria linicola]